MSRRSLALACLLVLALAGCGSTASTAPQPSGSTGASGSATSAAPQLVPLAQASAQLASDLRAAVTSTKIPSGLTPSLSQFEDSSMGQELAGTAFFKDCDAYGSPAQQSNPTPCVFGDAGSTKTIVLVGDSNVGNWAPALAAGLGASGYRFDVFGFAGCLTPDIDYTTSNDGNTDPNSSPSDCNTWHTAVAPAIRAVHPVAVVAVAAADNYDQIASADWIAGMTKLFDETTTATTARILMGTSPYLLQAAPTCLATHRNPKTCSLQYTSGTGDYGRYVARDPQIAAAAKATLIPTTTWLCLDGDCPPIIGTQLVYADTDHLTTLFSQTLAPEATAAVVAATRAG